jgi:hypothetical protein
VLIRKRKHSFSLYPIPSKLTLTVLFTKYILSFSKYIRSSTQRPNFSDPPFNITRISTCLEDHRSQARSVSIVSDYGLEDRAIEVRFPAEARGFSSTSVSTPALGPTQPPVQWVPGPYPRGQSAAGA